MNGFTEADNPILVEGDLVRFQSLKHKDWTGTARVIDVWFEEGLTFWKLRDVQYDHGLDFRADQVRILEILETRKAAPRRGAQ